MLMLSEKSQMWGWNPQTLGAVLWRGNRPSSTSFMLHLLDEQKQFKQKPKEHARRPMPRGWCLKS